MQLIRFSIVLNPKCRNSKSGVYPIYICANHNNERKYFNTGVLATNKEWDCKRQKLKTNTPNYQSGQSKINSLLDRLQQIEQEYSSTNKPFTLDILQDSLKGKKIICFIDFMFDEIKNNCKLANATIITHTTTANTLREYKKTVLFDNVDYSFLQGFETFLIKKELHTNTIEKYMRHIRTYVNRAIDKGYMNVTQYPFRRFKLKKEETHREHLTTEEVKKIEELIIPKGKEYLQKIKDIFLFECYTGLRFSDITSLSKNNFRNEDKGVWLVMTMQKTTTEIRLPIYILENGKPLEIVKRYERNGYKYIFDDITNQYANRMLKEIAELAHISKKITTHVGRHTSATYWLNAGVPITTVQKILGHKKLETTMIYTAITDNLIVSDLEKVENKK